MVQILQGTPGFTKLSRRLTASPVRPRTARRPRIGRRAVQSKYSSICCLRSSPLTNLKYIQGPVSLLLARRGCGRKVKGWASLAHRDAKLVTRASRPLGSGERMGRRGGPRGRPRATTRVAPTRVTARSDFFTPSGAWASRPRLQGGSRTLPLGVSTFILPSPVARKPTAPGAPTAWRQSSQVDS